jgi:hypothetical protein
MDHTTRIPRQAPEIAAVHEQIRQPFKGTRLCTLHFNVEPERRLEPAPSIGCGELRTNKPVVRRPAIWTLSRHPQSKRRSEVSNFQEFHETTRCAFRLFLKSRQTILAPSSHVAASHTHGLAVIRQQTGTQWTGNDFSSGIATGAKTHFLYDSQGVHRIRLY